MNITAIAAIIGALSGGISLISVIYFAVRWKTRVDSDLFGLKRNCEQYSPSEMWVMTKTLWEIYVIDALGRRPDLVTHASAFKLKKEGEDLIPDDIKEELDKIHLNSANNEAVASGYLVVKILGTQRISRMAEGQALSVQEAIAILSLYVSNQKGRPLDE